MWVAGRYWQVCAGRAVWAWASIVLVIPLLAWPQWAPERAQGQCVCMHGSCDAELSANGRARGRGYAIWGEGSRCRCDVKLSLMLELECTQNHSGTHSLPPYWRQRGPGARSRRAHTRGANCFAFRCRARGRLCACGGLGGGLGGQSGHGQAWNWCPHCWHGHKGHQGGRGGGVCSRTVTHGTHNSNCP